MEEGGGGKSAKPSAKLSDTRGGSVERHWWGVHPEAFIVSKRSASALPTFSCRSSKSSGRLCLRSRGFFCHFRSINYRSIRLSLYSLSFSPLYFPLYFSPSPLSLLPPLFFFFISNVQRTAFVRRGRKGGEKKKTRGTKRERAESFRFVERIASLFSIGRKCRIEVEFRLKRFHGVESCLADFYISRFPLVARATRGIDISRVCARFVAVWSVTNANTSVQDEIKESFCSRDSLTSPRNTVATKSSLLQQSRDIWVRLSFRRMIARHRSQISVTHGYVTRFPFPKEFFFENNKDKDF